MSANNYFDLESYKGPLTVEFAIKHCEVLQMLIENNTKLLDGLRIQCSVTEEITQREIRQLESKLVNLFCEQYVLKLQFKDGTRERLNKFPNLLKWLQVVGFKQPLLDNFERRKMTFEDVLKLTSEELDGLLIPYDATTETIQELHAANKSIQRCTVDMQTNNSNNTLVDMLKHSDLDLSWTLYRSNSSPQDGCGSSLAGSSSNSSSPCVGRQSTSSLPPDISPMSPHTRPDTPQSPLVNDYCNDSTASTPTEFHPAHPQIGVTVSVPLIPPSSPHNVSGRRFTPPASHTIGMQQNSNSSKQGKFPTTPPPQKRNKLCPEMLMHPLTKSVSHESQLSVKVGSTTVETDKLQKPENLLFLSSSESIYKRRRSTEDGNHSNRGIEKSASPVNISSAALLSPRHLPNEKPMVPLSPNTPLGSRSMMHSISHRFQTKLVVGPCDLCGKQVFLGKMCKFCKSKFHRDCAMKSAPACGLPKEYVDLVIDIMKEGRRVSSTLPVGVGLGNADLRHTASVPSFQVPGSGSTTSSCNSSTPPSPALGNFMMGGLDTGTGSIMSPLPHHSPAIHITYDGSPSNSLFKFPEVTKLSDMDNNESSTDAVDNGDMVNTTTSNDSDKSDRTLVDGATLDHHRISYLDRVDSTDSACDDGHHQQWSRMNSISVILKEWDIPYEELNVAEEIGTGRFGTVHKGNWHGEVAIKKLNMDPKTDNQSQLQAFKLEVAMLHKTRHENLVLFMGACMKPPHLAIITRLCKGMTLYTHIHVRHEKFQLNRSVIIASQIAQGMGYLHAKGIVHKDLKTKNIFLENGKVIITDFGLFSVTKLCHGNRKGQWLSIPPGWLCYLSPEIMHCLQSIQKQHHIPFTKASDVYAFGTVWYEMLCGEWPFKDQPPEAIIFQVGKGMKQSLANVHTSREIKDVLMMCWSYNQDDRPDFSQLLKTLERFPKKRLARSPSHPVQLTRGNESSVF